MKGLFLLLLFSFISCSDSGGKQKKVDSNSKLTQGQMKAKELIQSEIKSLQNTQYGISQKELELLKKEGLVSEEDLTSLNIIK